jgi:hypothetical protein
MIHSVTVTFGAKYLATWLLVFLPTILSVLLKITFFINLKSSKITSKIQISEVCDLQVILVMWHTVS